MQKVGREKLFPFVPRPYRCQTPQDETKTLNIRNRNRSTLLWQKKAQSSTWRPTLFVWPTSSFFRPRLWHPNFWQKGRWSHCRPTPFTESPHSSRTNRRYKSCTTSKVSLIISWCFILSIIKDPDIFSNDTLINYEWMAKIHLFTIKQGLPILWSNTPGLTKSTNVVQQVLYLIAYFCQQHCQINLPILTNRFVCTHR